LYTITLTTSALVVLTNESAKVKAFDLRKNQKNSIAAGASVKRRVDLSRKPGIWGDRHEQVGRTFGIPLATWRH
jgi:hypothetical protein